MITGFSHIYHRTRDLDEAIAWYTKNLGFKFLRKFELRGAAAAYVELDGVLLELSTIRDPAEIPVGERRLGFRTRDIDAVFDQLKKNGVEIVEDPRDARTFWGKQGAIKDPSGYIITLREWDEPDSPTYPDWQPKHDDVKRLA